MSVPVLAAATVVLLREGERPLEVFLLERNADSGFVPGAHLFPGGAVDDADAGPRLTARSTLAADRAADRLGRDDALAFWVAAIRETFEEAGLLLAEHAGGEPVDLDDAARGEPLASLRRRVDAGTLPFADVCERHELVLHTDRLLPFARWITPLGAPRRYDTRFFVAAAPPRQRASHDGVEAVDSLWTTPADALARERRGEWTMIEPTLRTLQILDRFDDVPTALAAIGEASAHGRAAEVREHGGVRVRLPFDEPVTEVSR